MARNSVTLLYDADGVYKKGAEFNQDDLRLGCIQVAGESCWMHGTRFEVRHTDGTAREVVIRYGWAVDLERGEVLMRLSKGHWRFVPAEEWAEWFVKNGGHSVKRG